MVQIRLSQIGNNDAGVRNLRLSVTAFLFWNHRFVNQLHVAKENLFMDCSELTLFPPKVSQLL